MRETLAFAPRVVVPQDIVTAYGWKVLAGSVIGYCMDGFDMLILGFMLAAISARNEHWAKIHGFCTLAARSRIRAPLSHIS